MALTNEDPTNQTTPAERAPVNTPESAQEAPAPHQNDEGADPSTPSPPALNSNVHSASTTPISSSKASKLSDIVGDGSFEQLMRERAKLRKEKDEHSVAELRVQLTHMERALSQEVKRRIETSAAMERQCTDRISAMETKFESIIEDRHAVIRKRLDMLEEKVEDLNGRFEEERVRIPRDIERRGKELEEILSELREEMETERRDRLNREGRIMKQMHDHSVDVAGRLDAERAERLETVEELKTRIRAGEDERKDSESGLSSLMDKELRALREAVERESRERKLEDDEIVAALNRYTDYLQSSLSVISSDD